MEKVYQSSFSFIPLGPSIFIKSVLKKLDTDPDLKNTREIKSEKILRCPYCKKGDILIEGDKLICNACKARTEVIDGIINFKLKDQ